VRKIPGPTENQIQSGIRDFLRFKGWFVIRHQQSLGSHPGLPDLQAVKGGVTWWIEVKKPGGRLSLVQEKFRDSIQAAGGNWMVAMSVEDIVAQIPELGGLFGHG
jgi:Holliday junction resolvase